MVVKIMMNLSVMQVMIIFGVITGKIKFGEMKEEQI